MIINGNLDLKGSSIKSLGEITEIYGNLNLRDCKNLQSLNNLKVVEGYLELNGCSKLKKLPNNLYIEDSLNIQNTDIEIIPIGLECEVFYANDKIVKIENKVKISDAWLNDCKNLKELPKDLKINRSMRLDIKNSIDKNYIENNNKKLIKKINWLDW